MSRGYSDEFLRSIVPPPIAEREPEPERAVRLPATCRGCGASVELRVGVEVPAPGPFMQKYKLATAWCEPGTDAVHACNERAFGLESRVQLSGPGAAETARDLANPDQTGASA